LPGARNVLCAGDGPVPLRQPTLDQALAHTRTYLQRTFGARALTAIDNAPGAGTADGAEHIAGAAVIGGAPGAALAAALQANRKAPADPRPLVNAAALLPDLGMAPEALTLLDAADRLPAPKGGAPLGIPLHAVSRNNRGYALLALRRWQQAVAPLREAIRLSPYLTEADLNLGEALMCTGDEAQAAHFFIAGARRNQFRPDRVDSTNVPPPTTDAAQAADLFDLSAGVQRQLPELKYPTTPGQAVAAYPMYHQIEYVTTLAVIKAGNARYSAALAKVPHNLNRATLQRTMDIIAAIGNAPNARGLRDLSTRLNADNHAVYVLTNNFWFTKVKTWDETLPPATLRATCTAALPAAHAQWLADMRALDHDTREYWRAYSKYATGLAANIANPAYHALAESLIAAQAENLYYTSLFGLVWSWDVSEWGHRFTCVQGEGAASPDLAWPAPRQTPPAAECGPGVAAPHNLVITLPPPFDHVSLKANCESISAQIESPEPGIKAFIAVGGDLRNGETTVIIGPKIGGSIPGTSFGGGFETGIYVTTDRTGIKDWGLSANLTGSAALSPHGLASFEANAPVTISLVGSIDYIPTAFGLSR
ncbi:MAG: hypothetical protein JWO42_2418, partial [Chloroflexi bacterium]|nr:hypothetical protein [Chloroflexota bacterium]